MTFQGNWWTQLSYLLVPAVGRCGFFRFLQGIQGPRREPGFLHSPGRQARDAHPGGTPTNVRISGHSAAFAIRGFLQVAFGALPKGIKAHQFRANSVLQVMGQGSGHFPYTCHANAIEVCF